MNKKLLLVLIALNSNQLFCAEAKKATAVALCRAAEHGKHFSYKIQPSNQITEEEASEHKALIDSLFKMSDPEKHFQIPCSQYLTEPSTFINEIRKERDVVISAYDMQEGKEQVLVGSLFGTKHRDVDKSRQWVKVITQINSICVANYVQRQGIGTHMLKLFQDYVKNLPIALYLRTTNIPAKRFWQSQAEFQQTTTWLGYELLKSEDPSTLLEREDVVTYYSKNNSGEALYIDSSDEEAL